MKSLSLKLVAAFLAITAYSNISMASALDIYKALNVQEQSVGEPVLGSATLAKSVGGLRCQITWVSQPSNITESKCRLNASGVDAQAIYEALNTAAVDGRPKDEYGNPSLGAEIMKKQIGTLICGKMTVVSPGAQAKFQCVVDIE